MRNGGQQRQQGLIPARAAIRLGGRLGGQSAAWLTGWSALARVTALGLALTAALPGLSAPEGGEPNVPAPVQPKVQPDPRPVKPRQPVQPVLLPPELQEQVQSAPMPGEPVANPAGPQAPNSGDPAETPTPAGTSTQPGTSPKTLQPGPMPVMPPAGTGLFSTPAPGPVKPVAGGSGKRPSPTAAPGEPEPAETHADLVASSTVKELLARADEKLEPGTAGDFSDADWKEFTTVIGGTPEGAAVADVPEEIWYEYEGAEHSLRQAVWNQIFGRPEEAARLAEEARAAYLRVEPQLRGDGVYNIVQRVAWGARIRKKFLLNQVMIVPTERALMSEHLDTLNREYRLYLVFKQQDPVKQRHNRAILTGEIWRNMREHKAPDRALAAVHKALTAMAEGIFDEDTREESPIGALIPTGDDSMEMLAGRNKLLSEYNTMVTDYDLFNKEQRDRLGRLGRALKLETDARQVYDQRRAEFATLKKENRWKEIKSMSLTVNGERDKFGGTYARETWEKFALEVEAALRTQSDTQLALYSQTLKTSNEGEKLVELKTEVLKDTQIFSGIDAQSWDALASNINIKIVEIKQSRGQKFLEDIRTQTQNTATKDGLDAIKEKLNARSNELAALNMVQEYNGVLKDINDRIDRFSQIGQASKQQVFYMEEVAKQKTSTELMALQEKIRSDRTSYTAVLDIPKWDELQQKASLQLDVLLKQEFIQKLAELEKKAEARKNDLAALELMINNDLVKAQKEAQRWGLIDRYTRLSDLVNGYQGTAQVADVQAEIARYNDELARAKSDREIGQVVLRLKALEERTKGLSVPKSVKEQVLTSKAEAEQWRESAKSAQKDIESAETALRDGL